MKSNHEDRMVTRAVFFAAIFRHMHLVRVVCSSIIRSQLVNELTSVAFFLALSLSIFVPGFIYMYVMRRKINDPSRSIASEELVVANSFVCELPRFIKKIFETDKQPSYLYIFI